MNGTSASTLRSLNGHSGPSGAGSSSGGEKGKSNVLAKGNGAAKGKGKDKGKVQDLNHSDSQQRWGSAGHADGSWWGSGGKGQSWQPQSDVSGRFEQGLREKKDKKEKKEGKDKKDKKEKKDKRESEALRLEDGVVAPTQVQACSGSAGPTVKSFYEFMLQREVVRLKRSQGQQWPWTDDPVLQHTRFANVKREHDRTGIVIQRILNSQDSAWGDASGSGVASYTEQQELAKGYVLSVALWRRFGSPDFICKLGFVPCPKSSAGLMVLKEQILDVACALWRDGVHACTDAYAPSRDGHAFELAAWLREPRRPQAGRSSAEASRRAEARRARVLQLWEAEQRGAPLRELRRLRRSLATRGGERCLRKAYACLLDGKAWPLEELFNRCGAICEAIGSGREHRRDKQSWQRAAEELGAVTGYGGRRAAHAAEVLRDLFTTPLLKGCFDMEKWAPVSPLARRCLARIKGRRPEDASPEQLFQDLTEVYAQRKSFWPGSIQGEPSVELKLHDVQAQLGEFERYLEASDGRPQRAVFEPRILL